MKKLVSILLCMTMLLSVSVMAASGEDGGGTAGSSGSSQATASDVITSVFFASDYQFYSALTPPLYSDVSISSCQPIVDKLVSMAKDANHDIETFVFGGDYTQNDANYNTTFLSKDDPVDVEIFGPELNWHYGNTPVYSIAEIKDAIDNYYSPSEDNMIFLQGNHEPDITKDETYGLTPMGAYEYDDYIVYVINDQDAAGPRPRCEDLSSDTSIAEDADGNKLITQITDPNAVVTATANALETYLNGLIESGDTRPVFISSHQPFYSEREKDSNGEIYLIFDVVNEAAKELDIIFFFAHTHQKS